MKNRTRIPESKEMSQMQISEKQNILTRTWVVAALACVCCILWGSAIPVIKTGYRIFAVDSADTASQIVFAGIRFALAGILVLLFASIREKELSFRTERYSSMLSQFALLRPSSSIFLLHRSGTYIRCKRRDHHRPRQFYCNFNGMSVSKK